MKKLLMSVIVIGFVIMLGAAGSADNADASFLNVLLLELLGVAVVLFGTSALMHYKRYVRRMMRKEAGKRRTRTSGNSFAAGISVREKELCQKA